MMTRYRTVERRNDPKREYKRLGMSKPFVLSVVWTVTLAWTVALMFGSLTGCNSETGRLSEVEKRLADLEKRLAEVETKTTVEANTAQQETTETESAEDKFTKRLKELEQRIVKSTPPSPVKPTTPPPAKTPPSAKTPAPDAKTPPPGDPGDSPRIQADEPEYDFGTTWVGAKLKHTFTIKNVGKKTLDITKVKPTCGCTAAGPYPDKLEPGETGQLSFTLDTKRLKGKFSKKIRVLSNDPKQAELLLTLRGVNKFYVEATPSTAMFGTIYGDEPQERIVKIRNNTDEPMTLKIANEKPPGVFAIDLQEKVPGKEFELRVTTKPPHKSGSLNGTITLETNRKNQPTVDVRAFARVADRLDIYPKLISLTKRGSTDRLFGHVRFSNNGPSPVKVLEATVDEPNITVKLHESKEGKLYTITLDAPASAKIPATGRTLTLTTDDAGKPAIKIPIRNAFATLQSKQGQSGKSSSRTKKRPVFDTLGKPTPPISAQTTAGKPVSNLEFTAAPATVLNFFAPNCGFCKKQIPKIEKVRAEFVEKGIRFINIRQTMRQPYTNEQTDEILRTLGSNLELVHDPNNKIGKSFKATSYPTMVIVGSDGRVKHVNVGAKPNIDETLRQQLKGMLNAASAVKPSS